MYKKVQHTQTQTKKEKRKNTEIAHNTKNKKKNNIKKFIEDQHNKKTIRQ